MDQERSLEYWCDMMVKTYNTSIVENFPTPLKLALKDEATRRIAEECVKRKPNPNSQKNRDVLTRLIKTYFEYKNLEKISPIDFIGGPHTLTLHWSAKYNKIIYTFGEKHRTNVCNYANMIIAEHFFERLFKHSGAFIDFFLEIEMLVEGEYKYPFSEYSTTDLRIDNLREQNAKCIESSQ